MLNSTIFDDFNALRREMNRLFDGGGSVSAPEQGWISAPVVETGWTDDHLNLRFVLPGVPEDRVEMSLQGNSLIVSGERPAPEGFSQNGQAHYRLSYGRFERKVDLPNGLNTDKVEATLHHGLLDIQIPIAESVKPRRIEIRGSVESGDKAKKIAA